MASVAFEDLTFSYAGSARRALEHVTLDVPDGSITLVCGRSGCGKTTLLRHAKTALSPHGERSGRVLVGGRELSSIPLGEQAARIGFVMQDPDSQIVSDKVWHELAFGLENLGCPAPEMRSRVAEMASYFGMEEWFRSDVSELSGGQKQMLNLASVMVMLPDVLVLDEPTSQLDPLAASSLLETVRRLNRDFGVTVVMAEHRLESAFPLADAVALIDAGRLALFGEPASVARSMLRDGEAMAAALPSASRIWSGVASATGARLAEGAPVPLTVREGRRWLAEAMVGAASTGASRRGEGASVGSAGAPLAGSPAAPLAGSSREAPGTPAGALADPAIELSDVWFRHARTSPDVLKGTTLAIPRGRISALMGGNGAGKTTFLRVICGACRPYRGKVRVLGRALGSWKGGSLFQGRLAMLPQDPLSLFAKDTVEGDLAEVLLARSPEGGRGRGGAQPGGAVGDGVAEAARAVGVSHLLRSHPADLSAGELERAAIAKVMLTGAEVVLLDEPTKGLDALAKRSLGGILRRLSDAGATVVVVSHDVEFCAEVADEVSLLFDGRIASSASPEAFFSSNAFYTTAASCIVRGTFSGAVTCGDVVRMCAEGLS